MQTYLKLLLELAKLQNLQCVLDFSKRDRKHIANKILLIIMYLAFELRSTPFTTEQHLGF